MTHGRPPLHCMPAAAEPPGSPSRAGRTLSADARRPAARGLGSCRSVASQAVARPFSFRSSRMLRPEADTFCTALVLQCSIRNAWRRSQLSLLTVGVSGDVRLGARHLGAVPRLPHNNCALLCLYAAPYRSGLDASTSVGCTPAVHMQTPSQLEAGRPASLTGPGHHELPHSRLADGRVAGLGNSVRVQAAGATLRLDSLSGHADALTVRPGTGARIAHTSECSACPGQV